MRILLTGPISVDPLRAHLDPPHRDTPLRGSGGAPVTTLASGLLARGHEVVVASCDADLSAPVTLEGPSLRMHLGPYRHRGRARDLFALERAHLSAAIAASESDLVHAHWTYEYAMAALSTGRPTLITVHDWAPTILAYHRDPYRAARLAMNTSVLARGRHFTAVSPYIAHRLGRWTRGDVRMVPNGISDAWFAKGPRDFPRAPPVIVCISNTFSRLKNVDTLFRAFPRVRAMVPGVVLRLYGEAFSLDGPARQWAHEYGLTGGVEFCGAIASEDIPAVLGGADLMVHPSREESFGLVLAEAMCQGLPVVGGACSGAVPWVLGEGNAGALTDVRDPLRLGDAVTALLSDEQRWRQLSAAGYARADMMYRASSVVDRYVGVYKDLRP